MFHLNKEMPVLKRDDDHDADGVNDSRLYQRLTRREVLVRFGLPAALLVCGGEAAWNATQKAHARVVRLRAEQERLVEQYGKPTQDDIDQQRSVAVDLVRSAASKAPTVDEVVAAGEALVHVEEGVAKLASIGPAVERAVDARNGWGVTTVVTTGFGLALAKATYDRLVQPNTLPQDDESDMKVVDL